MEKELNYLSEKIYTNKFIATERITIVEFINSLK